MLYPKQYPSGGNVLSAFELDEKLRMDDLSSSSVKTPGVIFDTIFKSSPYRSLHTHGLHSWVNGNPYLILLQSYLNSYLSATDPKSAMLLKLAAEYWIDVAQVVKRNCINAKKEMYARQSDQLPSGGVCVCVCVCVLY